MGAPGPGSYSVIMADPPWAYHNYGYAKTKDGRTAARGVRKEYHTMSDAEILDMPVSALADHNAALFLWATWPRLPLAVEAITAWGFEYYTIGFVWVKVSRGGEKLHWGMGRATRANTEPCLLARKGAGLKRVSAGVHSVLDGPVAVVDGAEYDHSLISPVTRHSAKPPEARDRIVELYGDVPRLELFARERTPGWDVFGDEIEDGGDWAYMPAEPGSSPAWYHVSTGEIITV